MINKQYVFSAVVRATPKDRDIMYMINMIAELYGSKVKLKKLIIQKCPKILHVYKCFQNVDSEKLINGLKELI